MLILVLVLSFFMHILLGMEIDEHVPLLKRFEIHYERDLEAQHKLPQERKIYLDCISPDVVQYLSNFVDADSPGMSLLLEKMSLSHAQATVLHKRLLRAYPDDATVMQKIESIENTSNRNILKNAAKRYQLIFEDFRRNKTEKIQRFFETELGTLESLRGITSLSRNEPEFNRIRQDLPYYNQIVNNCKKILENAELVECYTSFITNPKKYLLVAGLSALSPASFIIYGLLERVSFNVGSCWNSQANICLANNEAFNCTHSVFHCCDHFAKIMCLHLQQHYQVSHSAIDPWLPTIIGISFFASLNIFLQIIVRTCMRPPELSPELRTLVTNYNDEIERLKALFRNVS